MDNLTEEQQQRIQLNRQRALEMGKERRKNNIEKENNSQTTGATLRPESNNCSTSTAAAATLDINNNSEMAMMNNDKPARESFGDSSIDWAWQLVRWIEFYITQQGEQLLLNQQQKQLRMTQN